MFDKLAEEFKELFDFKITCTKVPNITYSDNIELIVLTHDMIMADFLRSKLWKSIKLYGSNKLRLQT